MAWLGLDWDEGPDKGGPYCPYSQDERRGYYQQCLEDLDARGLVYPCYCTRAELRGSALVPHSEESSTAHEGVTQAPHAGEFEPVYAGTCLTLSGEARAAREANGRLPSLRVKAPSVRIEFTDMALGPHAQELATQCGDFVLRRSDGVHAYQLAVVADDAAQRITEVVRGADLLESTARQIFLYRSFGWPEPRFAHVPLLVDPDGRRLSKRRGDVDLGRLRQMGVAPGTVVGYLAWKAGFLDAPRKALPQELLEGFSFEPLPVGSIVVEEDWMEVVR
jgi:glutamyl-tRNA synthetase